MHSPPESRKGILFTRKVSITWSHSRAYPLGSDPDGNGKCNHCGGITTVPKFEISRNIWVSQRQLSLSLRTCAIPVKAVIQFKNRIDIFCSISVFSIA